MAENKVRFSAEFASQGADKLKRDLEDIRQGRKDLNDVIGSGRQASQDAAQGMDASAQATQNVLKSVEDSTRALQAAFTALPQGVQQSLAQVMERIRQADFVGAMQEKARVRGVPQTFTDQLNGIAQATLQATTVLPEAAVSATIRQTLPQPEPSRAARHAATRAPGEASEYGIAGDVNDPVRLTPILRSSLEELKQGDLERARGQQRLAARTALREGDREGMETATRLSRAFREAQDKDNGIASSGRYAATLKSLEGRIEAAEAAEAEQHGSYLNSKTAMGRAHRTLSTVGATLSGGVYRGSEITGLEAQLGKVHAYLGQAEKGGAKGRELDDLKEQLEKLTDELGKTRGAYEQVQQQGGGGGSRQPDAPQGGGGGLNDALLDEMRRFAGSGMGGGFMGRAMMRLGPYGVAAGAVLAGNSLAERMVAAPNREARQRYAEDVDLARQFGYAGDPMLFRSGSSGLSDQRLIDMGYTARQASTTLARLDTPDAGRLEGAREDTYDALQLARSTGLDENQVASALTSLREAGAYKVGEAQEPLEVIRMALTESVRAGVSTSDTLRNLVELTAEGVRQGRSASPEALAMTAALQAELAKTGEKTLQGDAGAGAQESLNNMITGGDDPGMMMLLAPAVKDMTAEELGLEGAAARGYEELQHHSPLEAAFTALELLEDGRNPEASARLAQRLDHAMGDNPSLYNAVLERYGLGTEQRLTALGTEGGVGGIYEDAAAAATGAFAEGEALETDAQGENDKARRSAAVQARERDVQESKGTGTLNAFGDVGEMVNQGRTNLVRWGRNLLSQGGTYDDRDQQRLDQDGSLSNAPQVTPTRPAPVEITPRQRWQDRIDLISGWDRLFGGEQDDRAVSLELPTVGATVVGAVPIPIPDASATVRNTAAQVRPPARTQVRPRSDDEELALLDPRHAVAMLERQQLRAQGGLAEMAMGPGAVSGSARLTNQPGTPYGEEIAGVMGHRHVGERHQGVDVVIGEAGRPDPIYNPFEQATIMGAGESKLGGNYMIVQAPDGQPYKLSHLDQPIEQGRIGEVVPRGGVLGIEGMSGAATGYHLHMELLDDFGGPQGNINRRDNQDPQRFYERLYNSLEAGQPTAARDAEPANSRVDVFHHGLDNVRVEGLESGARQRAEEALRGFGGAIRTPPSHQGFG